MNEILKQRLVGALILLALGVVFWPIIFVEPGERPVAGQGGIPPRPAVDTTPIEPPDPSGLRTSPELTPDSEPEQQLVMEPDLEAEPAPATALESAAAVTAVDPEPAPEPAVPAEEPGRTRSEAPERPVLDSNGLPVAWILQVASVSSEAKADALRDRLLEMEQKAYVKKVMRGDKAFYRVYIGPRFEREPLEQLRPSIDARFKVKSMIVRYLP